ncbi:glycoside hydrolase superfamily [Aspergillus crustosus]
MEFVKSPSGWRSWSARKKSLIFGSILLFIVALAVGLGVGLGLGLNNDDNDNDNDSNNPNTNNPNTNNTEIWQPAVGTTWQIVLRYPLNDTSLDVDVYDIDLFDNPPATISALHASSRKVICYFSAGTYEDWRDDAEDFPEEDLGAKLPDWPGESWIDIRSPAIRAIMGARLDVARDKGCDGVDPDNVDGYDNDNGLDLTEADSVDYLNWLSGEARRRGLSIGLKNAGAIIERVIGGMQYSVNEQCAQYNECDVYAAFVAGVKPVFHIEYPKGDEVNDEVDVGERLVREACEFGEEGFSTLIKNMDLDNWVQNC